MDINKFLNIDCMEYMSTLPNRSVDLTITDIPYGKVQQVTNGLLTMDNLDTLGSANNLTFNTIDFCKEVNRITKNTVIIFCALEQFSEIIEYFKAQKGTTRVLVWEKTNPVPSNGQYVYLSGVELAVWFKRSGSKSFNAYCKNTVFRYPIPGGKRRIHKTQKHWDLWKELILDNSNEGELLFDPCAGSGVTAQVAKETNRNFICCELDKETYNISYKYLKDNNILE